MDSDAEMDEVFAQLADAADDEGAPAALVPVVPALAWGRAHARARDGDSDSDEERPARADPRPAEAAGRPRAARRGRREGAYDREAPGHTPTDGLAWGAARHKVWQSRLLTPGDPRAPDPPGFQGRLYAPQATILAAMLALERRPLVALAEPDAEAPGGGPALEAHAQTRAARIAERFSFGKTVLMLALVCASRVPARLPEPAPLATMAVSWHANRAGVTTRKAAADHVGNCVAGFLPEVSLRYARLLPLTVVYAAANVISQWEGEARRFAPALEFFTVDHVRSLREFETRYREGRAAGLALLFVKAGRVTANFVVEGEPPAPGGAKNRPLLGALARILEGVPVARLVVDDYDMLRLGGDDCLLPALFTWLVSATRRQTTARATLAPAATVAEFFRANAPAAFPVLGATLDDVLNKPLSLRCEPAFVDAHLNTTAIGFRRLFVRGGQAAAILRDLDAPVEFVERVNANAVRSVGDVIRRVVGAQLGKLQRALRALARAERARRELAGRAGPPERGRAVLSALRAALRDGSDAEAAAALAAVSGPSAEASAALAALDLWAAEQRDKYGKTLSRMRDNIREGHCQCCTLPLSEAADGGPSAAYILAACCQIIVCEHCITRPGGGRRAAAGAAPTVFAERCPNCARDIARGEGDSAGLIRVGPELDLEAALADGALEDGALAADEEGDAPADGGVFAAAAAAAADAADAAGDAAGDGGGALAAAALDDLDDPKLKALIQFVRGEPIDCLRDAPAEPYVGGLLDGRRDAPWPAARPRKILVFTMYPESTRAIEAGFARFGVAHGVLRGARAAKDEAVRAFREAAGAAALLVSAPKDCGGLHLPFVSHVYFYHEVVDKNVRDQVAARGQRLGREHNLEIVTCLNEAEAAALAGR